MSLASLFSLRFWNNKLLNDSLVAFEMCHDFKIDYILPSENLLRHLFVIPVQNVFSIYRLQVHSDLHGDKGEKRIIGQ